MNIPNKLQSVLWSTNTNHLNSQKDKYYIIHQILSRGSMEQIRWLFKNYQRDEIVQIFKKAFKDYSRPRFYFIKDIILGLRNWQPNEHSYVKNTPRVVG